MAVVRFAVRVTPHARREQVAPGEGRLKVAVRAQAIEGRANEAVIEALAAHFGLRRSAFRIVHGEASRDKLVEASAAELPAAILALARPRE